MVDASPKEIAQRIQARRSDLTPYFDFVDGKFPLVDADPEALVNYRQLIEDSKLNVCRLVVDVLSERARIQGWRPIGSGAGSEADGGAWLDWNRQRGDMYSRIAHRTAMTGRVCYIAVWNDRRRDRRYFTVEDPRDVVVEYEDGDFRRRLWSAKLWADDTRLTVWDDVELSVFRLEKSRMSGRPSWMLDEELSVEHGFAVDGDPVVPVVPLMNQPSLTREGVSDIADVMAPQKRINQTIWLRALATELTAVTQKWIANLDLPQDEDGNPVNPLQAHFAKLWLLESAEDRDLKTGEFSAADLRQFSQVIEGDLQHIAMITRIPRRFLMPTGQEPSGDALRSSESGLVAKVRERTDTWTEAWSEVMSLLRGPDAPMVQPIWIDPEVYTLGERVDAALKKQALGVPQAQLMEDIGYSPEQLARFSAMRMQAELEGMLAGGGGASVDTGALKAQVEAATALIRAGFDAQASVERAGLGNLPHTGLTPITLQRREELAGQPADEDAAAE